MHFGKRTKGPWRWRWRAKESGEEQEPMPLSSEDELAGFDHRQDLGVVVGAERNALLAVEPNGIAPEAAASPETAEGERDRAAFGDPTQQLLSVFGRIEPAMLRGKEGEPQELWAHAIMERLAESVEVAAAEGWSDLVTVLTETSRLFKTYQETGRAAECVSFIEDSYEILCLMVGDLIVDKIRSGVMQKWRDRYAVALTELAEAGLALVDAEAVVPIEADAELQGATEPQPELPLEHEADSDEDVPYPDAELESEDETAAAELDAPVVEDSSAEGLVDEPEEEIQEIPAETEDAPMADMQETTEEEPEPVAVEHLDALREALSEVSVDPEATPRSTYAAVDKCLVLLAREAEGEGRAEAGEACRVMARMCRSAYRKEASPNDRFFELAYAFCGVYFDTERIREWIDECSQFLDAWTKEPELPVPEEPSELVEESTTEPELEAEPEPELEAEPEPEPEAEPELEPELEVEPEPEPEPEPEAEPELEAEPEPEPEPEEEPEPQDDSAEQLLVTAQKAASEGNVAGAKELALRAAAQIAQAQIVQAEALVQETDARLSESAETIEAATQNVQQAKQEVSDAEERVRECQEEAEARGEAMAQVQSRLEEVQGRLAELDEQLREMQERRDEVEQQRCETEAELATAQDQHTEATEDHEVRLDDERRARDHVENLEEQEKELQWKRAAIEADMTQAREDLEQQQASAADIDKTIGEAPEADSDGEDSSDDLLF